MTNDIWVKISAELPGALVDSLRTEGLAKLASRMSGTDLTDERHIYESIGASLFYRKKEAAEIKRGILSVAALEADR